MDYEGHPRPVAALASQYSAELRRRSASERRSAAVQPEVLLLSSAALMHTLFRRMAYPTASAVGSALLRCGCEPDYLWTARNRLHIDAETLAAYRVVVIADSMFVRDATQTPELLRDYVRAGGTLVLPLGQYDTIEDPFGVRHPSPALRELSGVDLDGPRNWPGAGEPCRNWPFGAQPANEPGFDAHRFPRVLWAICPEFRHLAPAPGRQQMLGFTSYDGDYFTAVPALKAGAEVIAVSKYETGTKPFLYRHNLGRGTVYVNAWTNTMYRDRSPRQDYGEWDFDFFLAMALESAGVQSVDITGGPGLWLRNAWGYGLNS